MLLHILQNRRNHIIDYLASAIVRDIVHQCRLFVIILGDELLKEDIQEISVLQLVGYLIHNPKTKAINVVKINATYAQNLLPIYSLT